MSGERPRIVTEPLGGSPLAVAAQSGEASPWFGERPRSTDGWRTRMHDVAAGASGGWLDALGEAFGPQGPGGAAGARLREAVLRGGVVVTTGQQPGLFGGPLYTWTKALSARALADTLEARTGIPCAPVFWAATDDADFEEARSTSVATGGEVLHLRLASDPPAPHPMSRVPLGSEIASICERLADACGSAADARALDAVRAAYREGTTVGDAYVRLLRVLLEPLGVAVLDASHPAVRRQSRPVLDRALALAPAIERATRERDDALRDAGYAPQVSLVVGQSLVFSFAEDGKSRLPVGAVAPPEAVLGPNVLLRPIVERALLPTVAYLAGPGELAYFAQLSAVADVLGEPQPLAVPRWSATIIEPRVERALRVLGATRDELAHRARLEGRLAREVLPQPIAASLRALQHNLAETMDSLDTAVDRDPLVPRPVIDGARRDLGAKVLRLERRLLAGAKRRDAERMRLVAVATAALLPGGARQERTLNAIPFLARHGVALLDEMSVPAREHAAALIEPRNHDPGLVVGGPPVAP